jgi:hypothetical protein
VKNRMREICTSGSVRGGGGNVPTYSAKSEPRPVMRWLAHQATEAAIAIDLKQSTESLQVAGRMLTLAVLAIGISRTTDKG